MKTYQHVCPFCEEELFCVILKPEDSIPSTVAVGHSKGECWFCISCECWTLPKGARYRLKTKTINQELIS